MTTISTYQDLKAIAQAFANEHLTLLVLLGEAGLGKSRVVKHALGHQAEWFNGRMTAFEFYRQLWRCRDQSIVLDDVDDLFADRDAVRLLKALCQSELVRPVAWHSANRQLDEEGIPRSFETSSRVTIIANDWKTLNANVAALEDRGHLYDFQPDGSEVHRYAAAWFWDQEIFDFVADHLHLIGRPSLRYYVLGAEQKAAGLNWQRNLLSRWLSDETTRSVAELRADPSFASEEARIREFTVRTGKSRATFYNHLKRLGTTMTVPRLKVRGRKPGTPSADPPRKPPDLLGGIWDGRIGFDI